MKLLKYLVLGIIFGIVMSKSEAISWFRIYEMFRFRSFHMYGIILSAVLVGIVGIALIKKLKINNRYGRPIDLPLKQKSVARYLFGGIIFGAGWAMTGACPGPLFVLLGHGFVSIVIVVVGGLVGTIIYALIKNRLPH